TESKFPVDPSINVVADPGRAIELFLQDLLQRDILPPQVGGSQDHSVIQIEWPGTTASDARQTRAIQFSFLEKLFDGRANAFDPRGSSFGATSLLLAPRNRFELAIEQHGIHLGAAQIESHPGSIDRFLSACNGC